MKKLFWLSCACFIIPVELQSMRTDEERNPAVAELPSLLRDGDITQYPSYDGYQQLLYHFAKEYPHYCQTEAVGKSTKNRNILALRVGAGESSHKPRILFSCCLRGDELNGTMVLFNYFKRLLQRAESDPKAQRVLNGLNIWFVPFCNPDATYKGGNGSTIPKEPGGGGPIINLDRDYPMPGEENSEYPKHHETKVLMAFEKNKGFHYCIDFFDGMSAVVCPWAYTQERPPNWDWLERVGGAYAKTVGLPFGQASVQWFPMTRTRMDWQLHFNHCNNFRVFVGSKGANGQTMSYFTRHAPAIEQFLEDILAEAGP